MMAWVHASIGAAIGSKVRNPAGAFAAGVASHLLADLFPHRDYDLPVELPLVGVTLAVIAARHGLKSPELAGALGAISPDIENGLERLELTKGSVFPTHTKREWFIGHGERVESPLPQVILAAACLIFAEMGKR